jgi:hypothetical protein
VGVRKEMGFGAIGAAWIVSVGIPAKENARDLKFEISDFR